MALDLIERLCKALASRNINYCHWKSNAALDRSALGLNDLDLLVDRADAQAFNEILSGLCFKPFYHPGWLEVPGIQNYYGYDQPSERFVHVHVHYQLIIGHDMTKNFHLPVESAYLASASQPGLFRVPAPEFELAVFTIRMMIKHCTWDVILQRQSNLSTSERKELDDLLTRSDQDKLRGVVDQHLPNIGQALFQDCLKAVRPGSSVFFKMKTGQQLISAMRAHARHGQLADIGLKFGRRVALGIDHRIFHKRMGLTMAKGGTMVAVIGGDGSGKTTAIDGLESAFAPHFLTHRVHLGRPKWSFSTILIRGVLKIGRILGLNHFNEGDTLPPSQSFPGYAWMLRTVCTAHDRYNLYRKARRQALNGGLVICDRFPVPQYMPMDGPQCERILGAGRQSAFARYLIRLEKRYYQNILLPEVLVVLLLKPEIAVQRKTDETSASVERRSTLVWRTPWENTPACIIDANRSKEVVLAELKELVWSRM